MACNSEFFVNLKGVLKKVRAPLCRTDVWNYFLQCLEFLIEYLPSYFMERYAALQMLHLEFSLKYKIGLPGSNVEFTQKWCVVLLYYCDVLYYLYYCCKTFDRITPEFWWDIDKIIPRYFMEKIFRFCVAFGIFL